MRWLLDLALIIFIGYTRTIRYSCRVRRNQRTFRSVTYTILRIEMPVQIRRSLNLNLRFPPGCHWHGSTSLPSRLDPEIATKLKTFFGKIFRILLFLIGSNKSLGVVPAPPCT
jgi:hypothetical protein